MLSNPTIGMPSLNIIREWQQTDRAVHVPGNLVFDKTISLELPDDTLSEVNIELAPYLENGFGHFVVIVEPPKGMFESENEKWQRYSQTIHRMGAGHPDRCGCIHRLFRYDRLGD